MALKNLRVLYTSRNETTGLTDVTARIRRNGAEVASAVALTELNATNYPGIYELNIAPATLTSYGGAGFYQVYINSASKNAPATFAKFVLENDEDDLEAHLNTIGGKVDVIDGNVDTVLTQTTDIQAKVNNGTYGLAALQSLVIAIQSAVGNIQNNTRFSASVPSDLIRPPSGSTTYRIPISLFDTNGDMEDPDSNQIAVTIANPSGTSRKSYLVGYVDEPTPLYATRIAKGDYYVDVAIPNGATIEELIFQFSYLENTIAFTQRRVGSVVTDVQSSGFALETTAQSILTDTDEIQQKINNGTYGLSALRSAIDAAQADIDLIQAELASGTYGLSAIKTAVDSKASQTSVNNVQSDVAAIKGTGFATGTDSLKAISDRVYTGGYAT